MDIISDAWEESWRTEMMPHYTGEVRLNRVVAVDLTSLNTERAVTSAPTNTIGTFSGESSPSSSAIAIQKQTGSRGRGKQGRLFVGPLPESQVVFNTISATWADAYITSLIATIGVITDAFPTAVHVVLSRYLNGVKRAAGIGLPVLHIGYTNLNLDVQKDRLPDHKRRRRQTTP
jgi:hypothetical protein